MLPPGFFTEWDDAELLAIAHRAEAAARDDDLTTALNVARKLVIAARSSGSAAHVEKALCLEGALWQRAGRPDKAASAYGEALRASEPGTLRDTGIQADIMILQAKALLESGQTEPLGCLLREWLDLWGDSAPDAVGEMLFACQLVGNVDGGTALRGALQGILKDAVESGRAVRVALLELGLAAVEKYSGHAADADRYITDAVAHANGLPDSEVKDALLTGCGHFRFLLLTDEFRRTLDSAKGQSEHRPASHESGLPFVTVERAKGIASPLFFCSLTGLMGTNVSRDALKKDTVGAFYISHEVLHVKQMRTFLPVTLTLWDLIIRTMLDPIGSGMSRDLLRWSAVMSEFAPVLEGHALLVHILGDNLPAELRAQLLDAVVCQDGYMEPCAMLLGVPPHELDKQTFLSAADRMKAAFTSAGVKCDHSFAHALHSIINRTALLLAGQTRIEDILANGQALDLAARTLAAVQEHVVAHIDTKFLSELYGRSSSEGRRWMEGFNAVTTWPKVFAAPYVLCLLRQLNPCDNYHVSLPMAWAEDGAIGWQSLPAQRFVSSGGKEDSLYWMNHAAMMALIQMTSTGQGVCPFFALTGGRGCNVSKTVPSADFCTFTSLPTDILKRAAECPYFWGMLTSSLRHLYEYVQASTTEDPMLIDWFGGPPDLFDNVM